MKKGITEVDGKFYQKAKVVMLSAKNASKIVMRRANPHAFYYHDEPLKVRENSGFENIQLYFLSDEEIKEGDLVRHTNNDIGQVKKLYAISYDMKLPNGETSTDLSIVNCKKIIASTDESLTEKILAKRDSIGDLYANIRLPRPSNEFLQAYCKANGKIEEVLVEVKEHIEEDTTKDYVVGSGQPATIWHELKISPDNTITIKPTKEKPVMITLDGSIMYGEHDMFLNMQYYYEHCILHGYITPQKWIEEHKHF